MLRTVEEYEIGGHNYAIVVEYGAFHLNYGGCRVGEAHAGLNEVREDLWYHAIDTLQKDLKTHSEAAIITENLLRFLGVNSIVTNPGDMIAPYRVPKLERYYRRTVSSCLTCPNFLHPVEGRYRCQAAERRVRSTGEIPDWCPLPTQEEKNG